MSQRERQAKRYSREANARDAYERQRKLYQPKASAVAVKRVVGPMAPVAVKWSWWWRLKRWVADKFRVLRRAP